MKVFFIIFVLILSLDCKALFAQDAPLLFSPRENAIFTTLNNVEGMRQAQREQALRETMQEAQLKLAEGKFVRKKQESPSFTNLATRIHPYLTESITLDDNVDSTDEKKGAVVNNFTAGSKMNFVGKNRSSAIDAHIDNTLYNNRSRSNVQSAQASILNNFRLGRYTLSIADTYFNNYLAIKQLKVDDDDVTNYWQNTFKSSLGRSFNRVGFKLEYQRSDAYYEPVFEESNSTIETITFSPYLRITKKTTALLEYSYKRTKHNEVADPADSYSNDFNLSLGSVFLSKLSGVAKIDYKCTDSKTSAGTRDTTLTTNIGYALSARSNLALVLEHVIHEEATNSAYYTENDFQLTGNHRLIFNPKLKISFSSEADYINYPKMISLPNPRKNATYKLGLGLGYAFRQWLDFRLDWTYTKLKSNVDTDYNKNLIVFKSHATF